MIAVGHIGLALVLYANVALQAALGQLQRDSMLDESGPVASFSERQRMVQKAE